MMGLQGRRKRGIESRTMAELLRERIDGSDRVVRRRRSLTERLGFTACCGCLRPVSSTVDDDEPSREEASSEIESCFPASSGMNLAAALAAERNLRAVQDSDGLNTGPSPTLRPDNSVPLRMSLMRLLDETEGWDEKDHEGMGNDRVCCVCMGRKKGAAFIPCGHTYCRVCSRELWLNRGYCPLCNTSILEILDIY